MGVESSGVFTHFALGREGAGIQRKRKKRKVKYLESTTMNHRGSDHTHMHGCGVYPYTSISSRVRGDSYPPQKTNEENFM